MATGGSESGGAPAAAASTEISWDATDVSAASVWTYPAMYTAVIADAAKETNPRLNRLPGIGLERTERTLACVMNAINALSTLRLATGSLVRHPSPEGVVMGRGARYAGAMAPLQQYAVLVGLIAGTVGLVGVLGLLARALGGTRPEPGKDVPFSGGTLDQKPVWVRYHVHYYGFALLFLAFDMEMAFMYPWAVVYRELGLEALVDMGVFLAILFLGLLYGWSQGAFHRQ